MSGALVAPAVIQALIVMKPQAADLRRVLVDFRRPVVLATDDAAAGIESRHCRRRCVVARRRTESPSCCRVRRKALVATVVDGEDVRMVACRPRRGTTAGRRRYVDIMPSGGGWRSLHGSRSAGAESTMA